MDNSNKIDFMGWDSLDIKMIIIIEDILLMGVMMGEDNLN